MGTVYTVDPRQCLGLLAFFWVSCEVNFYAYIRELRPLGLMLHILGKQNLSLYTVDPRHFAHPAYMGKAEFVAIYGRPPQVGSSFIYRESRICRYIRSTRASLLILHILGKQNLSLYTVDPRQLAHLRPSLSDLGSQFLCIYT